jgi:hypothetical protein
MFMKGEFSNRLVQVSLFSAFVYYITAYPVVFEKARKYFPIKFKKTHNLLIFHTFVFAVLMYLLTYFVFDPIVSVVEGVGPQEIAVGQVYSCDTSHHKERHESKTGPHDATGSCGTTIYTCPGLIGFSDMGTNGGIKTVKCL